jgi:hypothetical protein
MRNLAVSFPDDPYGHPTRATSPNPAVPIQPISPPGTYGPPTGGFQPVGPQTYAAGPFPPPGGFLPPPKKKSRVGLIVGLSVLGLLLLVGVIVAAATTFPTSPTAAKQPVIVAPESGTTTPAANTPAATTPVATTPAATTPVATTPAAPPPPTKAAAPTIDDGTWTVGEDIPAGTYRVTGAGGDCYWAIYKSGQNQDFGAMINNHLGGGNLRVTVKKGQDFETEGCGTWTKVG